MGGLFYHHLVYLFIHEWILCRFFNKAMLTSFLCLFFLGNFAKHFMNLDADALNMKRKCAWKQYSRFLVLIRTAKSGMILSVLVQYNTMQYNTLYLTRVNILTFYSFLRYGPQKINSNRQEKSRIHSNKKNKH